jgi:PST family polysaccharide transporter
MDQATLEKIKGQTVHNILFLTFRNFGIQAITLVGFFILTIVLSTGDIGLFAIVSESVSILGYFSDIGLASALIQQKDEVNHQELQTTFWIQQLLVSLALSLAIILFYRFSLAHQYGSKEWSIFAALCFSFFAASLKTIPSVLLERQLNFRLISTIDILENLSFYFIAVAFALMGFGAYSYAYAAFSRSLLGLILIYYYQPWPFGFNFSLTAIKQLFRFGIPYQINSFIAVAKDRLSNLLVAGILGRESFGLLSWAQKGPRLPLSIMDALIRVTFPTFARLQDHPQELRRSLYKSLYFTSFLIFPALAGISLTAPNFISLVPKYTKWLPALIPLYLYALNAAIAAVTTPITNAFNAVGKISITTKLMVMWTLLTWIFYPWLSWQYGYLGTAFATLIVGSSSLVVWLLCQKYFQVNVFQAIFHPTISTLLMTLSLVALNTIQLPSLNLLVIKVVVGVFLYTSYHFSFSRLELFWLIRHLPFFSQKS